MHPLQDLIIFLTQKMSMTEVYQPVIILHLLVTGGTASKEDLAGVLSTYDESVQEYYERILMRWPKITLTKHGVVAYDRRAKTFKLNFQLNNEKALEEAKTICRVKIKEWLEKQANKADAPAPDASLRYRILKEAKGKCELCGISSKLSPIDVDHIVPRNKADKNGYVMKGGIRMHMNDERNLQALCFRCNRAKRDTDQTDFRVKEKLVRDKIPEVIRASGRTPRTKILTGRSLRKALFEKLTEEHVELLENPTVEEVADMIEVLLAISKDIGFSESDTLKKVHAKRKDRGGFEQGIYLLDSE